MAENELLPLENLPVEESKVKAASAEINFENPTLTISYGAKTMDEISKFTDSLLGSVFKIQERLAKASLISCCASKM